MDKIRKVLVSQPKPESDKSPYFDLAEKHSLKIDFQKFIRIEGVSSKEYRESKVRILDHSGVIFTSRIAIDNFFRICEESRINVPDTMKYFCATESIALYLQKYIVYRKRKIFFGDKSIDELIEIIKAKHSNGKLLLTLSDTPVEELSGKLDSNDIKYSNLVLFHTLSCDLIKDIEDIYDYDLIVFFTPAGTTSLFENFPEFKQAEIKVATFGPSTQKAAIEAGLRIDIKAPTKEAPSMTMAIDQYVADYAKNTRKK